jgi:hypothetical protein
MKYATRVNEQSSFGALHPAENYALTALALGILRVLEYGNSNVRGCPA